MFFFQFQMQLKVQQWTITKKQLTQLKVFLLNERCKIVLAIFNQISFEQRLVIFKFNPILQFHNNWIVHVLKWLLSDLRLQNGAGNFCIWCHCDFTPIWWFIMELWKLDETSRASNSSSSSSMVFFVDDSFRNTIRCIKYNFSAVREC